MFPIICYVSSNKNNDKNNVTNKLSPPFFFHMFEQYNWRRAWQLTSVSLPEESHGQRNLVSCSPWGHKESGTTERLTLNTKHPPRMATLSLLFQVLL